MRQKIIAGNWKLNGTREEAKALLSDLLPHLASAQAQTVVCPPFTLLESVAGLLQGSSVGLGGQDVFWKAKGAYTGQIAPGMLKELGCTYAIVGHSERRGRFGVPEADFDAQVLAYFGDSNETVNRKLRACLSADLIPICCVGETLQERQEEQTDAIVAGQTVASLKDVTAEQVAQVVFAYEPVWAIGTGEVCASDEADRVCGLIRQTVGTLYGDAAAEAIRVQYGGSVKPDNAVELLNKPNIDGALVGGASLKAADFYAIIAAVE